MARLDWNAQQKFVPLFPGMNVFRVACCLHSSMGNSKNIPFTKLVRLRLTCRQELAQQILPIHRVLATLLPLVEFRERDPRDECVPGCEEGHVLPQRVSPQEMIQERDLTNDAIVPLRIVDGFDSTVHVDASIKEAEFSRKCHFSENLQSG
jgi:hypothetical protein